MNKLNELEIIDRLSSIHAYATALIYAIAGGEIDQEPRDALDTIALELKGRISDLVKQLDAQRAKEPGE